MNRNLVGLVAVAAACPKSNILVMTRHGFKDGQNISNECLNNIIANGIDGVDPSLITVFAGGSAMVRSSQTILAFMVHTMKVTRKYFQVLFPPSASFGSDWMFSEIYNENVLEKMKAEELTNLEAAQIDGDVFFKYLREMKKEVKKMLGWKSGDGRSIIFSSTHSPTVEMLAYAYGYDYPVAKELDGICLVTTPNGIKVYPLN